MSEGYQTRGRDRRGRRYAALGAAGAMMLFALFGLVACGGGDDNSTSTTGTATSGGSGSAATATSSGGSGVTLDAGKADPIAHQAMLKPEDLPGTGWTVTNTDKFDDSGIGVDVQGAGCSTISDKLKSVQQDLNAARAGRASVELGKDSGLVPTSVQSTVEIYKNSDAPKKGFDAFKSALGGDSFEKCLNDSLKQGFQGTQQAPTVNVKSVDPGTTAPESGYARAYDIDVAAGGISISMHAEFYSWRYANAGVSVFLLGSKDDVKPDLPKAAVTKTQDKLKSAS